MNLNSGIKNLFPFIKVVSTVLIASAIGLELWNIQGTITNSHLPSSLNPVFWIERFALTAHLIEAAIASYYAPTKNKMPIKYGIYTFFVGTVGLLELFEKD